MDTLITAILKDDVPQVRSLLKGDPGLATRLVEEERLYDAQIFHWLYIGDTALHLAAAGYRVDIVRALLAAGADANAAQNRRCSGPLHYAADGYITGPAWDAGKQVETIQVLIKAGADVHAQDKNGAAPLHRAVRTGCAEAVRTLLRAGSDPTLKNHSGSTPFHLAVQDTGRGGSGTEQSRAAQRMIIREFLSAGVSAALKDGKGKSVVECARHGWIREMLSGLRDGPTSDT